MIEVEVRKRLGQFELDVSFSADEEMVVLFGHSGSGKSLTLKAIAGLIRPDQGRITLDGQAMFNAAGGVDIPPQRRGVGYVPQQLALFPHLTARQNAEYGLVGWKRSKRHARGDELLELLELAPLADRYPSQLSGGQQQRVALARALAPGSRVLLLDEPFSALDSHLRRSLRQELRRLKDRLGLTVLFVTHDLTEAYNLADRMVVLDDGKTIDNGPRDRIYRAPASGRVAELIEFGNVLDGIVLPAEGGGQRVAVGDVVLDTREFGVGTGERVLVAIRPEQILLLRDGRAGGPNTAHVYGRVIEETHHGKAHTLLFELADGLRLEVEVPAHPYEVLDVEHKKEWWLGLRSESLHIMPKV